MSALHSKRVAFATLFGTLIFVTKIAIPSPFDKMFILIHAILLALGALVLKRFGATYVALIGGILTALWRIAHAPFSFTFALLYGLLVDGFFYIFKVRISEKRVVTSRIVVATTVSTAFTGLLSYYTTIYLFNILPANPILEAAIFIGGILSGALAGFFASVIWNRYLKDFKL